LLSEPAPEPDETVDPFGGLILDETPEPSMPPEDAAADEPVDAQEPAPEEEAPEEAAEDDPVADDAGYRKIFETKFRGMAPDMRMALAPQATGDDLSALCLDPDPKVIAAVLKNPTFGLAHARLIAFHHHNPVGLEHLASRNELVRDALVFRRLLRNPQLGAGLLRRLMQSRRMLEVYRASIDRDIPDLARTTLRGLLRTKFASQAQPEERAELILGTEGRVLVQLAGCTIDARTTQILCGRQVYSALFIQNVARFGASPPALLAHLAKLPFVRRNPGLKKALIQHANMPGDVKRGM
jgi:hypothetical protein